MLTLSAISFWFVLLVQITILSLIVRVSWLFEKSLSWCALNFSFCPRDYLIDHNHIIWNIVRLFTIDHGFLFLLQDVEHNSQIVLMSCFSFLCFWFPLIFSSRFRSRLSDAHMRPLCAFLLIKQETMQSSSFHVRSVTEFSYASAGFQRLAVLEGYLCFVPTSTLGIVNFGFERMLCATIDAGVSRIWEALPCHLEKLLFLLDTQRRKMGPIFFYCWMAVTESFTDSHTISQTSLLLWLSIPCIPRLNFWLKSTGGSHNSILPWLSFRCIPLNRSNSIVGSLKFAVYFMRWVERLYY